jgi:phage N-6-adenine-methyltransferase
MGCYTLCHAVYLGRGAIVKNCGAMFSSDRPDWATPSEIFGPLCDEFGFTLDVCATSENAKLIRFFSPEQNGLLQTWAPERCWMNPPYGREMDKWILKAYQESQNGALVVALVPSRTDTKWFHEYVLGKSEIRFVKGRIRFVGATCGAPFPSMVIIWRPTGSRS